LLYSKFEKTGAEPQQRGKSGRSLREDRAGVPKARLRRPDVCGAVTPGPVARTMRHMTTERAILSPDLTVATDAEADWDALFAEQMPRIYNFFRYRVGAGPDAEDLTSITFEKAWRHRHRYRKDRGAFTTWLYTIARRVGIDHARARRDLRSLDEAAHLPDRGATPEEVAVRRSDVERVLSLLAELPDRERELIALKYGAELSNQEIARATGLSDSNVGTILSRTIQSLRARYDAPGGGT
jgi:RNA polymerase sigma factor (sigma-70 family)